MPIHYPAISYRSVRSTPIENAKFYGPYVEAVKWGGPRRVVGLQTNAKPKKVLRWYRSLGLDNHHADMEVWDRRLFEWMCPGKAKLVGWDNWVHWLIESVDVFPEGETKPLFVAGAEMAQPHGFKTVDEAVGSTTEGMDYLMKHGVLPRFQHWRREFGSDLVKSHPQPPIPLDYFIRCMGNRYELWKRYRMPLPMSGRLIKPLRYIGVSHGTYEDYILLKENALCVRCPSASSTPTRTSTSPTTSASSHTWSPAASSSPTIS